MSRTPYSTTLTFAAAALGLATAASCGCALPGMGSLAAKAPQSPKAEDWLAEAHAKPARRETPVAAKDETPSSEATEKEGYAVRGQSPGYTPGYSSGSGAGSAPSNSYFTSPGGSPSNAQASTPPSSNAFGSEGDASGSRLSWASPAAFLDDDSTAPSGNGANAGVGMDPYTARPTVMAQNGFAPAPGEAYPPGSVVMPPPGVPGGNMVYPSPSDTIVGPGPLMPANFADIDAFVEEARTGRLIIGAGVNSEAGLTGQIIVDERNFNPFAIPWSLNDWAEGRAFRGDGQGFRLEAIPGTNVQRYLVSLSNPYLFNTLVTSNLSAFYFERNYFDYDEQRVGGRLGLGYRLTQDLSFSLGSRIENIKIGDPRVAGVQELDEVIGSNELYSGQASLTYDTRDIPFFPTEGQYLELSYEQVFGDFEYPRFEADYRRYFLLNQRPDGSGRHTLAAGARFGLTGPDTPLYDNYFAGGFSTLRGFDFRGASPVKNSVTVGGEMRILTSVEYFFPLTADDMIKGVLFVDAGTVEEKPGVNWDDFRVAPGFGFRLNVPALGAAPLAFDFAFPIANAEFDDTQIFSFYIGIGKL